MQWSKKNEWFKSSEFCSGTNQQKVPLISDEGEQCVGDVDAGRCGGTKKYGSRVYIEKRIEWNEIQVRNKNSNDVPRLFW